MRIEGQPLDSVLGIKSRFLGNGGEKCSVEELALQFYAAEANGGWTGNTSSLQVIWCFQLIMPSAFLRCTHNCSWTRAHVLHAEVLLCCFSFIDAISFITSCSSLLHKRSLAGRTSPQASNLHINCCNLQASMLRVAFGLHYLAYLCGTFSSWMCQMCSRQPFRPPRLT